jgi:hypothetical protein
MGGSRRAADFRLADMRGFSAPVEAAEGSFALLGLACKLHGCDGMSSAACDGVALHHLMSSALSDSGLIVEMAQRHNELACVCDMHAGTQVGSMVVLAFFLAIGLAQQNHRQVCTQAFGNSESARLRIADRSRA